MSQIPKNAKFRAARKNNHNVNFLGLKKTKLISRKIWVAEKSWNFHRFPTLKLTWLITKFSKTSNLTIFTKSGHSSLFVCLGSVLCRLSTQLFWQLEVAVLLMAQAAVGGSLRRRQAAVLAMDTSNAWPCLLFRRARPLLLQISSSRPAS